MQSLVLSKDDFSVTIGYSYEGRGIYLIYVENELNRVSVAQASGKKKAQEFADMFLMNFVMMRYTAEDVKEFKDEEGEDGQ